MVRGCGVFQVLVVALSVSVALLDVQAYLPHPAHPTIIPWCRRPGAHLVKHSVCPYRLRGPRGATAASAGPESTLLEWARGKGAWVSEKIALRPTEYGGRSFFAVQRVEQGEEVARMPVGSDFVLTQAAVRADARVGTAIRRWEAEQGSTSGSNLEVEEVLAVFIAAVKLNLLDCEWTAYVNALPIKIPNLPMKWESESAEMLPNPDARQQARARLLECKSKCLPILLSLQPANDANNNMSLSPTATQTHAAEPDYGNSLAEYYSELLCTVDGAVVGTHEQEGVVRKLAAGQVSKAEADRALEWAWCMVHSRALREVASLTGDSKGQHARGEVKDRFCFPVADLFDHAPSPLPTTYVHLRETVFRATSFEKSRWHLRAPSLSASLLRDREKIRDREDAAGGTEQEALCFCAAEAIEVGQEVTWTYGKLTNEEMMMQYGFIPTAHVHGDSRVGFAVGARVFAKGLAALEKESPSNSDVTASKQQVLSSLLGVDVTDVAGEAVTSRQLLFEATLGRVPGLVRASGLPVPLTTIVKYMCVTDSAEMAAMVLTKASDDAAVLYEERIHLRNELRALNWCVWLLHQIDQSMFSDRKLSPKGLAAAAGEQDVDTSGDMAAATLVGHEERHVLMTSLQVSRHVPTRRVFVGA